METHLDVALQGDVWSTLSKCELIRSGTAEAKSSIQSLRVQQGGSGLRLRRRRRTFGGEQRRLMTLSEMVEVYSILSRLLPALERLRIQYRGTKLPLKVLSVALENAKNLSLIRIFDVKFTMGNISTDEATNLEKELANKLRSHPALKRVYLDLCQSSSDDEIFSDYLQPMTSMVCALAENPNMDEISLSNTRISTQNLENGSPLLWLQRLCQSPYLRTLKLEMLDEIRNEHFVTLAQELSSRLSDLHIESCHLKQSACTTLAQMIEQNEMLQRLELVLYHNNNANTTDDATTELPREIDWNATGIADALTRNTSLKYVRIFAENISKRNYSDAFVRMLQTNVHLEYLVLGWDGESSSDIEFYLLMNRHGRRHLTEQAPKATWINFISQHANNLRVIHYVLIRNPSLFKR